MSQLALRALLCAVAVTATALYVGVIADLPDYGFGPDLPWWALALAFAAAELFVVHAHVRGSAHSISLSELPLIVGLLLAAPQDLVLAQIAGPAVVLAFTRGHAPLKLAFNLAQFALSACLSVLVLHALAPATDTLSAPVWLGALVAVAAGSLAAAGLVMLAIALSEGAIPSRRVFAMMGGDLLVAMTNACVGLAAAIVVVHDPAASWLLLAPAGVLLLAYRAYLAERRKHESLDFLYGVARSLSRAPDIETAMMDLLERARESFRVRSAELVLLSTGAMTPLRTSLGPDEQREVMEPVEPGLADALLAAVQDEHGTFVERATADGELARYLELRGIEQALVAPVPGETRLTGVMLLGDRIGASTSFTSEDLRIFETLANHTGVSLKYDRLEQAIARMTELQERLERQAYTDALTGLANRSRYMDQLERSLSRREGSATVLFIDLDGFKQVNDVAGHAAGDAVLVAVAERIGRCVRPADVAARLGGDEFAVLLEDVDQAHAERVAHRILELLGAPVALGDDDTCVLSSMGIATAVAGSLDADELTRRSDVAMYRAKHCGKGQVRVWDPEMDPTSASRSPTPAELRTGLAAGQLVAHYQPIRALDSGRIVAVEALARWQHQRHGLLVPSAFVPMAETTGQISAIDRAVLAQACREAASWVDGPFAGAALHVNISAVALRTPDVIATVEETLAITGLDPGRLVLELTESVFIADQHTAVATVSALRELGVRIALDDFGTGYSSLSCLRSLPIDILKVPKPFVDSVPGSAHDRALLAMIVDFGALLGIQVVVEGIEREDQLAIVRELSCELGQGYLLGRPVQVPALTTSRLPQADGADDRHGLVAWSPTRRRKAHRPHPETTGGSPPSAFVTATG